MQKEKDQFSITFLPERVTVRASSDQMLHRIALSAGLHIDAACGGNGTCGKCKVRIISGEFDSRPSPKLKAEQIREGYVLACLTRPLSDMVVELPVSELGLAVIEEGTAVRSAAGLARKSLFEQELAGLVVEPRARRIDVDVEPPALNRSTSDAERTAMAIGKSLGWDDVRVSLKILKDLPTLLRKNGWRISAYVDSVGKKVYSIGAPRDGKDLLGIAVDIGTTTIVVYLASLSSGKLLAVSSNYNRQMEAGDDVISRIVFSLKGNGLEILKELVTATVNDLCVSAARKAGVELEDVGAIVVTGNSTMLHIFFGVTPRYIREEPYVLAAREFPLVMASELGINVPNAVVMALPCVASYLGADITAGVVASGMHRSSEITLFMDLGTNGEIVVGNKEWMVGCSCSAGPAFEGGGVACGMRASVGAIGGVRISSVDQPPELDVIGGSRPKGICGSGMISLLGELYLSGIIDRRGKFYEEISSPQIISVEGFRAYLLARASESATREPIYLSEVDIDNLIRAKAAVYAGISTLLDEVDLSVYDIDRIYIAGGFGSYIDVDSAVAIGLLPDTSRDRVYFLGNTSIMGAFLALISTKREDEIRQVAENITYIELSTNHKFMERYVSSLFLPHTNIEEFPSVSKLLAERTKVRLR